MSAEVRLGRSLWSSPLASFTLSRHIRHDNQVIALGPMLSTSDRFRFFGKGRLVNQARLAMAQMRVPEIPLSRRCWGDSGRDADIV